MAEQLDVTKESKIKAAMSRAKSLIQLESSGALDKIAKGVRSGIGADLMGKGEMDVKSLMSTQVPKSMAINESSQSAAKYIPAAIRESFSKTKIDESPLMSMGGGDDALDFLTESLMAEETVQKPKRTQQDISRIVNEGLGNTTQQNIDYPMIRTIVEEIVRKYTSSLSKKILSEGKGGVNEVSTIAIGKTFKFLDSSGNIYECQMKKVGNINNKKRNIE